MATPDNSFLVFRCPDAGCARQFKMKKPAKAGKYRIACPHCGKPMTINIPESATTGDTAKPSGNGTVKKSQAPADNSSRDIIRVEGDFVAGTKYTILCPHCKSIKMGYVPQEAGEKGFPCPKCHGRISVKARDVDPVDGDFTVDQPCRLQCPHCNNPIVHTPENEGLNTFHCPTCSGRVAIEAHKSTTPINLSVSVNHIRGKLQLLRKWGFNKSFPLPVGHHVIGRYDDDAQSDIAIKDDPSMSRRSIEIDVDQSEKGYSYKLKVLKSTNPVLHNNQPLNNGDVISLNFGDSIILGKTQLRFVKDM